MSEVVSLSQLVFPALSPVVQIEEGKEGTDQTEEGALTKEQLAGKVKVFITKIHLKKDILSVLHQDRIVRA